MEAARIDLGGGTTGPERARFAKVMATAQGKPKDKKRVLERISLAEADFGICCEC